ncbi:MAG TPA: hypothetical protein VIK79_11505 [Xanthobacteraceae bacterium]|jgi:hypothetical protein
MRRSSAFHRRFAAPPNREDIFARLIVDYLRLGRADPLVFDLNPAGDALREYLPRLARRADLDAIADPMGLFDRLVTQDGIANVVDLGYGAFERFFDIAEQIGLFGERECQSLQSLILFAADPHPISANSYAQLRRRFQSAVVVPIFNEAISQGKDCATTFLLSRGCGATAAFEPCADAQGANAKVTLLLFRFP